jgi:hypothetical protein
VGKRERREKFEKLLFELLLINRETYALEFGVESGSCLFPALRQQVGSGWKLADPLNPLDWTKRDKVFLLVQPEKW